MTNLEKIAQDDVEYYLVVGRIVYPCLLHGTAVLKQSFIGGVILTKNELKARIEEKENK